MQRSSRFVGEVVVVEIARSVLVRGMARTSSGRGVRVASVVTGMLLVVGWRDNGGGVKVSASGRVAFVIIYLFCNRVTKPLLLRSTKSSDFTSTVFACVPSRVPLSFQSSSLSPATGAGEQETTHDRITC